MDAYYYTLNELVPCISQSSLVVAVGIAAICYFGYAILNSILFTPFKLYVLAQHLPGIDLRKLGSWAVVTGSSRGIGKEYAKVLAKKGLNLFLISLLEQELAEVKEEFEAQYKIQVKTLVIDFSGTDIYETIEEELEGLDVAILVNNVGVAGNTMKFLQTPNLIKYTENMLHINCMAMTCMTALVLPMMLKKQKGVIVSISSMASAGYVGSSTYSATKSYVSRLCDNLRRTYRDSGVIIQTIEPGAVATDMLDLALTNGRKKVDFLEIGQKSSSVSPEAFARSAANTIGWAESCNGHVIHHFLVLIEYMMPNSVIDRALLADIDKASQ